MNETPTIPRAERYAAGKNLRITVSRESQGDFVPAPDRDPLPILTANDAKRVPSLVAERYRRMSASPFAFFRGAAAIMAHDFAHAPRIGAPVQSSGDCHLMNFGALMSPEGRVLFDINDFDETYPGVDFIVDLKRLAASVAVAAEAAGLSDKKAKQIVRATVQGYRVFIADFAEKSPLEIWKVAMDLADELSTLEDDALQTKVLRELVKAEKNAKPADDFPDVLFDKAGVMNIGEKPPAIFHVARDGTRADSACNPESFARYSETLLADRLTLFQRFSFRDAAFKVVGVGSVGTFCAVGLLATGDDEPLILQMKQAWSSTVAELSSSRTEYRNEGQRVVEGQRAMQAASDPFLGWTQDDVGRQFYIRQLKNRKLSSVDELFEDKALLPYAILCGRTLARAHARTGDPARIAGYMGQTDVIDTALADFALAYTRQNKSDHGKLCASPLGPDHATGASGTSSARDPRVKAVSHH